MCIIALDWCPPNDGKDCRLIVASNRDEYYERPSLPPHFWNNAADDYETFEESCKGGHHHEEKKDDDITINNNKNKRQSIQMYAGKDLRWGGTWLACSSNGRFTAITNFHSVQDFGKTYQKSRGEIPVQFCKEYSHLTAMEYVTTVLETVQHEYSGFNAFLFDGSDLIYCSNRYHARRRRAEQPNNNNNDDDDDCNNSSSASTSDEQFSFFATKLPQGLYGLSNHLLDTP